MKASLKSLVQGTPGTEATKPSPSAPSPEQADQPKRYRTAQTRTETRRFGSSTLVPSQSVNKPIFPPVSAVFAASTPKNVRQACRSETPYHPLPGYTSDALVRITAGQIDPSGNIWLANNWKLDANPDQNPGENAVVIAIGAAAPIMTPLIGPPAPFQRRQRAPN